MGLLESLRELVSTHAGETAPPEAVPTTPQQAVGEPLQPTDPIAAPAPPSGFKVGDEIRLADGTVAVVAAPPAEAAPPVIPPTNPVKPPVTQTQTTNSLDAIERMDYKQINEAWDKGDLQKQIRGLKL